MSEETPQEETLPFDYVRALWRRKGLIAGLFVLSVVVTMGVSLKLPKYYKCEAVILASAPQVSGLNAALSAGPLTDAVMAGSLSEGLAASPADKILVLLKSRTVAEMVIKRFDLLHVFYEKKWDAQKGTWKEGVKPPFLEDAVKVLAKRVVSFKKGREGSIAITVEWKDPRLAAEIANYYIVALFELMKDRSITIAVQTIDSAVPVHRQSSPRVAMNIAIAGILSLFIGALLALFLERRSGQGKV